MQYVIIGNSTAATFAVEGIRARDKRGKIVILSDEARPAYGRPLISYYLYGRIALENTAYRPASFYAENAVEVFMSSNFNEIIMMNSCQGPVPLYRPRRDTRAWSANSPS